MKYNNLRFTNKQKGFSLIELMIALVIGMFLISGVFTVYINSHDSRMIIENEVKMLDDARFALETIGYDLRHAGIFGKLSEKHLVVPQSIASTGECYAGWASNSNSPIFVHDDSAAGVAGCVSQYLQGDILEMRYTLPDAAAVLSANTIYVVGDVNTAEYIKGGRVPATVDDPLNYQAVSRTYYISNWSDAVGDGMPSLHMVSLLPDSTVTDTMILSGVQNLQIQFGVDSDGDGAVDQYLNPTAGLDWDKVVTAQVWIVVRSRDVYLGYDGSETVALPTGTLTFPNDGYKRIVVNSVFQLRNIRKG